MFGFIKKKQDKKQPTDFNLNLPPEVAINPFSGEPIEPSSSVDVAPPDLGLQADNSKKTSWLPSWGNKNKQHLGVSSESAVDLEMEAADKKIPHRIEAFFSWLHNTNIGSRYPLLAFQAGSFGLRGALVEREQNLAKLAWVAESNNVDFTRAIAEVIEQLKTQHSRLPRTAILLTPSVLSTLAYLPVSPLRPRTDEEMRELIHWEMEGTLTQQNKHWLIGSMMVERGYISAVQRDELVEELRIRQGKGGQQQLLRFGDLAVQLGYISPEQLEECFVLQGKLIAMDDELAYGWQTEEFVDEKAFSDEALLSAADDSDSSHKWLVSGISQTVRRRWVGAFNLNGLRLQAFYPVVGSSFAWLANESDAGEQFLLEVHQEQMVLLAGTKIGLLDIQFTERKPGDLTSAEIQQMLDLIPGMEVDTLYLNAPGMNLTPALPELAAPLTVRLEELVLPHSVQVLGEPVVETGLVALLGAVNHYLGLIPVARLRSIVARDSKPPFWKNIFSWNNLKKLILIAVIGAMIGFLGWMHWQWNYQENRIARLNQRWNEDKAKKARFQQIISEQTSLKQQIQQANQEVSSNKEIIEFVRKTLPRQRSLMQLILKVVTISMPDSVTLNSLQRSGEQVSIKAQAVSDADGQLFVNVLDQALRPIGMQVSFSDVAWSGSGELPYSVNIALVKREIDNKWLAPAPPTPANKEETAQ